ncbi:MAG: chemotaxis protein CheB [Gammaproteobacteria bacterium]|nr:chemotaxis protein CheB [Gammaproteobacteria bacterium]
MSYAAVVIGVSTGGPAALSTILSALPRDFPLPLLIVQHMAPNIGDSLAEHLNKLSEIEVKEAQDKEHIQAGTAYLAPGGYHLLVEADHTLSLNSDDHVCYSRPSIDVLFESAADIFRESLIGIILTGANNDGSNGLKLIKTYDGLSIAQDPKTAKEMYMPAKAIKATEVDLIVSVETIAPLLCRIVRENHEKTGCANERE